MQLTYRKAKWPLLSNTDILTQKMTYKAYGPWVLEYRSKANGSTSLMSSLTLVVSVSAVEPFNSANHFSGKNCIPCVIFFGGEEAGRRVGFKQ